MSVADHDWIDPVTPPTRSAPPAPGDAPKKRPLTVSKPPSSGLVVLTLSTVGFVVKPLM
jgi:hypothetical protein